jgi:hypothetical protein
VSVVVDATDSGFHQLQQVADSNLVPYFRIEPTIGPFARAAADYVLNLNATDAALIFQNEAGARMLCHIPRPHSANAQSVRRQGIELGSSRVRVPLNTPISRP